MPLITQNDPCSRLVPQSEKLCDRIGSRAAKLFATRQLMCSEAVFSVLNQVLKGGLPSGLAIQLSSGFPEGLGGSGCTCGALTGGVMGLGLFLGRSRTGFRNGNTVLTTTKQLHSFFRTQFGATCCRVLTKNLKRGSQSHFTYCADKVGLTARTSAQLILDHKPRLLESADWEVLNQRETVLKTRLEKVAGAIGLAHARTGR